MKLSRTTSRLSTILIVVVAILLLAFQFASSLSDVSTPLETMELGARDTMMRLRGTQAPSNDIAIVAIDDSSFSWTGYQWPWPRAYLAKIVDAINKGGARVVGLDVYLFEPGSDPGGDTALAKALDESSASVLDLQISRNPQQNTTSLHLPLDVYRQVADSIGITTTVQDNDAITRSLQAYDRYGDSTYYNWTFALAGQYLGIAPPSNPSPTGLTFNGKQVPLYKGRLLINYDGPAKTFPTYSAYQVVLGDTLEQNPNAFKDKIVLIGATTITLHDVFATPFSAQNLTPGVEVNADAVDMLIRGDYLRQVPPWISLLIILIMAVIAGLISRIGRPSLTLAVMAVGMILYALVIYFTFAARGLYLPAMAPQLMLFLGVVLPTLEQAVSQELEKRRVRNLFTRFIAPEMVDQLIATQDINSLNKRADVSVLFSDIRGFTTLSEKLPPEEVVALLNPYLEAMTRIIDDFGGTVDKYEGDAIVAFFGEPVVHEDHALRAVRSAWKMHMELASLHERWEKEGRPYQIEIGIGINSGDVFVGLLGSAQRVNYTIIGDNANLASRLQDLTKTYQWPILISESTYNQVSAEFNAELVDSVVVKGRTAPVDVYKLIGPKNSTVQTE